MINYYNRFRNFKDDDPLITKLEEIEYNWRKNLPPDTGDKLQTIVVKVLWLQLLTMRGSLDY